jgi:hypothetical protein
MPRVSILLPNLNNRPFLEERLDTIRAQTFADWELVVSDNFSSDGAWEFFQSAAAADPRIRIEQAPKQGLYANWNRCLARARGEFVYIATSDDTMTPDCLAELVAALDAHRDCDIAQCCLHGIDEHGAIIPDWWRLIGAARFLGDDYLRPHRRNAPYDGVVHSAMKTMYHSITQVLVRRAVFDRTGPFPTAYGSAGDFCWGMKAGMTCNVVHVPKFLATWRIHGAQASATYRETPDEYARMARMVDEALAARPAGTAAARLPAAPLRFPYLYEFHRLTYGGASRASAKLLAFARLVFTAPRVALGAARLVLIGQRRAFDRRAYAQRLLRRFDLENHFSLLPGPATPPPQP